MNIDDSAWDWGFPVVGSGSLLNEYYVAWAPATGPNPLASGYLDLGHPIFVSPQSDNTTIKVDWDADEIFDTEVTLNAGEWAALRDPDGDNTGARVIGLPGSGGGGGNDSAVGDAVEPVPEEETRCR